MATAIQKITLSSAQDIPFNKLVLSQSNVRRVKAGVSIDELAESITRRGLIQSLHVRPVLDADGQETGMYEVPAGGRRFRALQLLVKQKRLTKTSKVPCVVSDANADILVDEVSLAENIERAPLHPLDQFRAFQAMREKGMTEEAIAAAFFASVQVVKQRLRLAAVSPSLLDIYAEDGITLEQLMAFTVTNDHARQEQVWESVRNSWQREPYQIRRMLTETAVRASDKRAVFVGIDAYETNGGCVLRDLFQDDDGGWLQDPALLDRLVADKLKASAEAIAGEGWKWIEVAMSFPYGATHGLREIVGTPLDLTADEQATIEALNAECAKLEAEYENADELPDEIDQRLGEIETALASFDERPVHYEPADIAIAGVFVSLDADGTLSIDRGYVRPEDEIANQAGDGEGEEQDGGDDDADYPASPSVQRAVITICGKPAEPEEEDEDDTIKPLPDRLITELTADRTLALRDKLATDPSVAFVAVLHKFCQDVFYGGSQYGFAMEVSVRGTTFHSQPEGLRDSVYAKAIEARHDSWRKRLPAKVADLWDGLAALTGPEQAELFAHCASFGVNALYERADRYGGRVSAHSVEQRIADARAPARLWPLQRDHLVEAPLLRARRRGRRDHHRQADRHLPDPARRRAGGSVMARLDASDLAQRLGRQAEAVCRHYLSNGHRQGNYWQVGDARNTKGRSMYVRLKDSPKGPAGKWTDAATGEHGDLLDVIRESCGLIDFKDVADEARLFLSMPPPAPEPSAFQPLAPAPHGSPEAARRLIRMSQPIAGTIVAAYLRQRGITDLRGAGNLYFHPHCYYRPDEHAPTETWPAMIAAVTDLDGMITGAHRTWLDSRRHDKAPFETPRRAMGDRRGQEPEACPHLPHRREAGIVSDERDPEKEEGRTPGSAPQPQPTDDDARPLTGEPAATMRLRAEPPRVTRLSRKVLAGLGLAASLGVGGALIYALQTRHSGQGQELYSTDNRSTPDGLAGLPKDYSGVPKLGPPLPGDLGRPILNAQNGGTVPPIGAPASGPTGPSPEEQRRAQELEAARTARLFASTETRPATAGASTQPTATATPSADLASLGLAPQPATPSAQDRQLAFLNQTPDKRTVSPDRVAAPASKNVLQAGAVIAAALITGIRSDLPGQITAQVTENIYDSPTGKILLVPQGTRVIGQYDSGVGFGQRRILLVWNRLIFPNGRSIVLERQPGADAEGYAGLEDGVDYHWGELFKAAALSTILSIGAEAGSSGQDSDIVRALRQGASNSVSQTGQQIVQRQLNIAPTLTIRPGLPVRVIVTRDLVLEPYGG